jgi:hypothetical protein
VLRRGAVLRRDECDRGDGLLLRPLFHLGLVTAPLQDTDNRDYDSGGNRD